MKAKIHFYKGVELIETRELYHMNKPKGKSETLRMYQILGSMIISKILDKEVNLVILIKE